MRLARRNARRSARSPVMSCRSATSDAKTSSFSVVAEMPTCLAPASTPSVTSCFVSPVAMVSLIVNGVRRTTKALPAFSMCRAFAGEHGISGLPRMFKTNTFKVSPLRIPAGSACSARRPVVRPEGRFSSFVNVGKGFLSASPFLPLRTFKHRPQSVGLG